jgi:hypothetical protein
LAVDKSLPQAKDDVEAAREGIPDGCHVSRSCFCCPLAECMWEQPTARKAYVKDQKTLEVFKQYQHLGTAQTAAVTAQALQISTRGVYRMLKRQATR